MKTITLTKAQRVVLASRWNDMANDANQIDAEKVHTLFGDETDAEIIETGESIVECRGFHSWTGNPETMTITQDDVTITDVHYPSFETHDADGDPVPM